MIVPAVGLRHHEHSGPRLPDDEAQFPLAVDGDDGVADRPGQDRPEDDDLCLPPVGQLHGHHVALLHARPAQGRREGQCLSRQLPVGQADVTLDQGQPVRVGGRGS